MNGKIESIKLRTEDEFQVGTQHNDEIMIAGIQYKRDGNPDYRGPEGCYEVLVVTAQDLEAKEDGKKEVPLRLFATVPGAMVALVTHNTATPKEKKSSEPNIVLEKVV